MCMTSEQTHCTFIKIQPTWISDHSRFDFALGFESRDGFKCRPKVTTTSIPLTTTQALIDCPNLTKPNLPYGNWICSSSGKYCAFSCPSDFTKSKVCYRFFCFLFISFLFPFSRPLFTVLFSLFSLS